MSTSISDLPYNPPPKQAQTVELPVRDIPRETIQHTTDVQTTPNYIPPKQQEYIESQPVVYQQSPSKIDKILEEFKIPILLSVLYFIFQLPTIHSFIIRMFPSIVQNGELSTIGFVVKSICFGLSYHIVTFIMDYLNQP